MSPIILVILLSFPNNNACLPSSRLKITTLPPFDSGRGPRGAVYPVKIRMKNPATFDTYDDLEAAYYDFIRK